MKSISETTLDDVAGPGPHVFTIPTGGGTWTSWCSVHGGLHTYTDQRFAALDALGHAAHFHKV